MGGSLNIAGIALFPSPPTATEAAPGWLQTRRSDLTRHLSSKQLALMPVYSSCTSLRLSSQPPAALNASSKSLKHTNEALLHSLPAHVRSRAFTNAHTHTDNSPSYIKYVEFLFKTGKWIDYMSKVYLSLWSASRKWRESHWKCLNNSCN